MDKADVFVSFDDFVIRRYNTRDCDALKAILRKNLAENFHSDVYPEAAEEERKYADESCDGDMSKIEETYFGSGGYFWTLVKGEVPVGMVGLEVKSADVGELRRMHLAGEARGKGAGHRLVEQLLKFAAQKVRSDKSIGCGMLFCKTTCNNRD